MTLAWYGHLRFKETPLIGVIVASWGIAFVEYCLAVPANRLGNAVYTTAQLKTIQDRHTAGVCRLLHSLSQGADHLELRRRLCFGCSRRVLYFPRPAVRPQPHP
jgi:uncharacterized protein (DUF486 family)